MVKNQLEGAGMKTAVYFGGTFDPIHQEHIRVCDLAYNEVRPDKLMLAPAPDGLCKRAAASAEQRLQMCRIAASLAGSFRY